MPKLTMTIDKTGIVECAPDECANNKFDHDFAGVIFTISTEGDAKSVAADESNIRVTFGGEIRSDNWYAFINTFELMSSSKTKSKIKGPVWYLTAEGSPNLIVTNDSIQFVMKTVVQNTSNEIDFTYDVKFEEARESMAELKKYLDETVDIPCVPLKEK